MTGRGYAASVRAGRAVVVGNSDGIGMALTRRLLANGWFVAGVSRRTSDVRHERYSHTVVDVTADGYRSALRALTEHPVDLCVYAAGIGEFLALDRLDEQTRTFEVNLLGLAKTVEAVVPGMVAAGRGHVIGISSLADASASDAAPAYAASKAGMSTYLGGLNLALRSHGVNVTAVRFGFVDTKMAKGEARPAMMSVEAAVDVLMHTLRTRPAVISRPRRMAAAVAVARLVIGLRLRAR
jgi:short-subunit dehydrogenase